MNPTRLLRVIRQKYNKTKFCIFVADVPFYGVLTVFPVNPRETVYNTTIIKLFFQE